ncbi:MAG: DUF2059 domain-containing protein [Candidatus Obscuribacterales bacterium]|nr:DUF2059 domain-containing protein [Candidatus Obscuribacterales bacterium]
MRKFSSALMIFCLLSPAAAYSGEEKSGSDKTRVLVDQIIEAVEAEKLSAEEQEAFKKKNKERVERVVDAIADKANMSAEAKAELKAKIAEKREQHHSMPPEMKEKLEKRFDFKGFNKESSYTVLKDHFSDTELKSILKFLKSSTGKKLIKETPDMICEVFELALERYVPIVIDLVKELKMPPALNGPNANPEKRKEMMEKIRKMLQEQMPSPMPHSDAPAKDET